MLLLLLLLLLLTEIIVMIVIVRVIIIKQYWMRFCDIQYNQGRGRLRVITLTETLIILDITKTESNN